MTLHHGDCLEVMPTFAAESVDAIVTDPPYGLGFMGKHWDHGVPGVDFWREMYRVLKPGGYLLSFAGTRTVHRFGVAIEDAGFEIRDTLMWIYASGFPKSLDVSKALDKVAGAEREKVPNGAPVKRMIPGADQNKTGDWTKNNGREYQPGVEIPATDLARKWEGWGTALKPAHEPIVMARKPLIGTVAQNVTRYGTGALNIDGARIGTDDNLNGGAYAKNGTGREDGWGMQRTGGAGEYVQPTGRWPSNVLLSSPELFDEPNPGVVGSGATLSANPNSTRGQRVVGEGWASRQGDENSWRGNGEAVGYTDSGGYSRFFKIPSGDPLRYEVVCERCGTIHPMPFGWEPLEHLGEGYCETCGSPQLGIRRAKAGTDRSYPTAYLVPKASRAERERGLERVSDARANTHPTVKPIDLMRHLVRLVTPPGGTVLDPFAGSGSTLIAAQMEGFAWIGIEREAEYVAIAEGRLNGVQKGLGLR